MKTIKTLTVLFLFSAITFAQTKWSFDSAHSKVGFSVTHLVISEVEGSFKSFEGDVTSTNDDFTDAKVNFTIDVNSINTENESRDKHLKAEDFFDAAKFPKIQFNSTSFKKVKGNKYKLVGNLTMKDVTKEVELDVKYNGTIKDPWGNTKAGFKITGDLNRFDYNLKFNALMEAGGAVVGEDVEITINTELTKQK